MTETLTTPTASSSLTIAQLLKKNLAWILIFAVLVAVTMFTFTNQPSGNAETFSTENAQPNGSMALAEVLGNQGVNVVAVNQFEKLEQLSAQNPESQILLVDPKGLLKTDSFAKLPTMSKRLILLQPGFNRLSQLGLGSTVMNAGIPSSDPLIADRCDSSGSNSGEFDRGGSLSWLEEAAKRAGSLSANSTGYRTGTISTGAGTAPTNMITCFTNPENSDVSAVVGIEQGGKETIILGHYGLLTNDTVMLEGNASFALNLLGKEPTLYWYMPSFLDAESGQPSLADLTPPWVTPVIIVLMMTFAAFAIHRGRRMGPLVAEKLPVTVPANETVEGRARLYQHGQSLDYVLNQLRMGTLGRLAAVLGISRNSNYQMIVLQAAALTGQPVEHLDRLLISGPVRNEHDLMTMSDELLKLEKAVTAAVTP